MNIDKVWDNSKSLNTATGLTLEEGEELLQDFLDERESQKSGCGSAGGRPEILSTRDIFTMTLIHYRHYLSFEMLALMFNVSSSTAKRVFDESESLIRRVLAKKNFSHLIAPDRRKRFAESLSDNGKYISMVLNSR